MTDKTDKWDFEHAPRATPEAPLLARIATLEALLSKANEVLSAIGKCADEIEHCILKQPEYGSPDNFIGAISYDLSRSARSTAERIGKELKK